MSSANAPDDIPRSYNVPVTEDPHEHDYETVFQEGWDSYFYGPSCPYDTSDPRYDAWWDGYDWANDQTSEGL